MMPAMKKAIGKHNELATNKNRTAAEEAEFRGYPEAEIELGYRWQKSPGPQGGPLIYDGEPPREYSQSRGEFVDKLKLLDSEDRVTADGIEWLRKNIPGFEHKSTDELRAESERGTILEKLFWAEYGDEFRRRRTNTNLVFMPEEVKGTQTVPTVANVVNEIGRQVPLQEGARDALKRNTGAFIAADEGVLRPLGEVLQSHPDPKVRKWYQEFTDGVVGAKKPDLVEFDVPNRMGFVLDFTQAYGDPVHNFKTLFYLRVFELMISGTEFRGADYRSPRRQRPIGPARPAGR
jgi:hypothetical protein